MAAGISGPISPWSPATSTAASPVGTWACATPSELFSSVAGQPRKRHGRAGRGPRPALRQLRPTGCAAALPAVADGVAELDLAIGRNAQREVEGLCVALVRGVALVLQGPLAPAVGVL